MSIWESIVGTFECCEPSKVSRGNNRFGEVSGDCCAPTRSLIGNDAEARKPIHSRLQALTQSRPSFHDARHLTAATDLYEGMPVQHLIEVQVIQTHTSFIVTVGSELYDAFDRKDCQHARLPIISCGGWCAGIYATSHAPNWQSPTHLSFIQGIQNHSFT